MHNSKQSIQLVVSNSTLNNILVGNSYVLSVTDYSRNSLINEGKTNGPLGTICTENSVCATF